MKRISFAVAIVLLSFWAPAARAAESRYCVPTRGVRGSLMEFEGILRECGRRPDCWEKERAVLEKALADHPDDPHLHRAYQDLFTRWAPSGKDVARDLEPWYRRLVEEQPENPVYLYAYGRYVEDASVARGLFLRAIAAAPDFPWAHVGMAYAAASLGEAGDAEELKHHLGRFIELCPSRSKVALSYTDNVDDPEFWRRHLPRLRDALRQEPVAGTYVHFAQVWQLELASTPAGEHRRVHKRVAADLARIVDLGLWDVPDWTATVLAGYRILGDDDKTARFEERLRKRSAGGVDEE